MNILDLLNKKEEKHLTFKKYTPNKTIFKEGDRCFNIGIILEGSIKIVSYSLLGNELVFNILNKEKFSDIFKKQNRSSLKCYLPLLVRLYMQYTFRTYSTPVFGTYARLGF